MTRIFITILLVFGTLVAVSFYAGPEWKKFRNVQKEIDGLGRISVELDEITEERDALIELINTISTEELARINVSLPEGASAANFLVFLERISAENGVVLKSVALASFTEEKRETTGQPTPGGAVLTPPATRTIKEFPITIQVSGTYESFKAFLELLEKNIRLIDVDSLSFSSHGDTKVIDFSIKAKTYYQ